MVENKKTDTQTTEDKKKGWLKIEEEFNTKSLHSRSWTILKTKWENLKTESRKYHAANKIKLLKTGGGKSNPPNENKLLEKVKILVSATIDGLQSSYDSDADCILQTQESAINVSVNTSVFPETLLQIIPDTSDLTSTNLQDNGLTFDLVFNKSLSTQISEETQQPEEQTWSQWTPAKLRMPISPALKLAEPLQSTYKASSMSQAITEAATCEKNAKKHTLANRRRPKRIQSEGNKLLAAKLELMELAKIMLWRKQN